MSNKCLVRIRRRVCVVRPRITRMARIKRRACAYVPCCAPCGFLGALIVRRGQKPPETSLDSLQLSEGQLLQRTLFPIHSSSFNGSSRLTDSLTSARILPRVSADNVGQASKTTFNSRSASVGPPAGPGEASDCVSPAFWRFGSSPSAPIQSHPTLHSKTPEKRPLCRVFRGFLVGTSPALQSPRFGQFRSVFDLIAARLQRAAACLYGVESVGGIGQCRPKANPIEPQRGPCGLRSLAGSVVSPRLRSSRSTRRQREWGTMHTAPFCACCAGSATASAIAPARRP